MMCCWASASCAISMSAVQREQTGALTASAVGARVPWVRERTRGMSWYFAVRQRAKRRREEGALRCDCSRAWFISVLERCTAAPQHSLWRLGLHSHCTFVVSSPRRNTWSTATGDTAVIHAVSTHVRAYRPMPKPRARHRNIAPGALDLHSHHMFNVFPSPRRPIRARLAPAIQEHSLIRRFVHRMLHQRAWSFTLKACGRQMEVVS